jgi:hypothetical protein
MVSIDVKVAGYGRRAGGSGPAAAAHDGLDALTSAVAPLRPPDDARRFSKLVELDSPAVRRHPPIHGPDRSLALWTQRLVHPGTVPRVLLPLAYESHAKALAGMDAGPSTHVCRAR